MLNTHVSTLSLHAHQTGTKAWEWSENEPQKKMHSDDEYTFFGCGNFTIEFFKMTLNRFDAFYFSEVFKFKLSGEQWTLSRAKKIKDSFGGIGEGCGFRARKIVHFITIEPFIECLCICKRLKKQYFIFYCAIEKLVGFSGHLPTANQSNEHLKPFLKQKKQNSKQFLYQSQQIN